MMKETIKKLEDAIDGAVGNAVGEMEEGAELIAAASEALGIMRTVQDVNLMQIMYDMARLAAGGGWCPEDFEEKANG